MQIDNKIIHKLVSRIEDVVFQNINDNSQFEEVMIELSIVFAKRYLSEEANYSIEDTKEIYNKVLRVGAVKIVNEIE